MEEFLGVENLLELEPKNNNLNNDNIQRILDEITKFDIIDFITRISALNLVSENQNKAILFDYIIEMVLTLKKDYTKSKMKDKKFKQIVRQIEKLSIANQIDPIETTFVDNIMYYENYLVFQGTSNYSSYNLQNAIEILILQADNLPREFVLKANRLIYVMLQISDKIAKYLDISLEDTKPTDNHQIKIPNKVKFNKICNAIKINTDEFKRSLLYDDLLEDIYYKDRRDSSINMENYDSLSFFNAPFLENNTDTIVLNVSILPSYTLHKIILLADKYGCKNRFLRSYNNNAFKNTKKALSKLGHIRLKSESLGITLRNTDKYKEDIYSVYNDKILILRYICDNGDEYSKENMFSYIDALDISKDLEIRSNYLVKNLKSYGVLEENIFEIIVMNSTGRALSCAFSKYVSSYLPIRLHPFELECIAINERDKDMFLPRYIKAKSKLLYSSAILFNELNMIEVYTRSNYSFYLNDSFSPTKNMLYIMGEYAIDYIIRAKEKTNLQMVSSYKENYYTKVIRSSEKRNIYIEESSKFIEGVNLLVKYENIDVWIISQSIGTMEELDVYTSIIDCLSYWLSELEPLVGDYNTNFSKIIIEINLVVDAKKYFEVKNLDGEKFEDNIIIFRYNNKIKIDINDIAFGLFSSKINDIEKEFVLIVLEVILGSEFIQKNKYEINKIFENKYKKKFYSIKVDDNPLAKPVIDKTIRKIRMEDEGELLDFIGQKVLQENGGKYGIISDEERKKFANKVVGYLYECLQQEVNNLSSDGLIEMLIEELEKVAFNLTICKNRYESDLLCYPEKGDNLINEFSELNKSSLALKFLIEYVSAVQPNGNIRLGEWEYEKILAICSLIIDWAYKNDLFYYKIFNTPIEILKSDRVGMKKDEFNKLELLNRKAMDESLKANTFGKYSIFDDIGLLNEAFLDEFDFSFDDFKEFIWAMINLNNKEVGRYDIRSLITEISNSYLNLSKDRIEKMIEQVALTSRKDYLVAPKGYRNEDIYPWRFNRNLSFTRRPVIIRNNEVLWGNRQLYHMFIFIIDLINEGKFKAKRNKLKDLMGHVSNKRGEAFNDAVYEKIKNCGFKVFKNIKNINKKKIQDENRKALGDIDILYIIQKKKIIVVGEVKDFNFSKSPYEMQLEYQKMFEDTEKKKSFATKHQRRCDWVKDHIDDLKIEFGLSNSKWRVKSIFLVNEPIISNTFYNKNLKVITYDQIRADKLEDI